MRVIHKCAINVEDEFELLLPRNAKCLSVQEQHGVPQSWWLLDPVALKRPRKFRVRTTGHEWQERPSEVEMFLGTFQLLGGNFVGHLFEVQPRVEGLP